MIAAFIVYDEVTGEILRTGSCVDTDVSLQAQAGEIVVEGIAQDAKQYIDILTQEVLIKDTIVLAITPAGTGWDISGIPNPTQVLITSPATDPIVVTITDGLLEYRTDAIGQHLLDFTSVKHVHHVEALDKT